MRPETVANAIQDAVQAAEACRASLASRPAAVRCALVDPILWSLGWRTWVPWECQPESTLGRNGSVDYALFNRAGEAVVAVLVRPWPPRREEDRRRLRDRARAIAQGVAVLTYGWEWEVYDLECRAPNFLDRRVEGLKLDHEGPNNVERAAEALYHWLGRDRWW